jgi:hypothetical protein
MNAPALRVNILVYINKQSGEQIRGKQSCCGDMIIVRTYAFSPFKFITNKRRVISSEGFSALIKNAVICTQRAVLPIQQGTIARCTLKWLFGALFYNLGRV